MDERTFTVEVENALTEGIVMSLITWKYKRYNYTIITPIRQKHSCDKTLLVWICEVQKSHCPHGSKFQRDQRSQVRMIMETKRRRPCVTTYQKITLTSERRVGFEISQHLASVYTYQSFLNRGQKQDPVKEGSTTPSCTFKTHYEACGRP